MNHQAPKAPAVLLELADRVVWSQKIKKVKIFFPASKSYSIDPSNAIPRLPNSTSTNYNKDFTIRFAFTGFNAILYGIFICIYIYLYLYSFSLCAKTYPKRLFLLLFFRLFCVLFYEFAVDRLDEYVGVSRTLNG